MKVRKSSIIVAIVMAVAMAFLLCCICAEAKTPRNGMVTDKAGNTYIYKHGKLQTGWVHYKGNIYYAHKTKSYSFPKGSICKSTYRVRGHRMYYFDEKGRRLKKGFQIHRPEQGKQISALHLCSRDGRQEIPL